MPNPPLAIGGVNLLQPLRRLFNAFGSRANTRHAVFTQGGMNLLKTAVSYIVSRNNNQRGLRLTYGVVSNSFGDKITLPTG